MTVAELIARYRSESFDQVVPYLATDEQLLLLFDDAQREACIRGRLIHEWADPAICQVTVSAGVSAYPLHAALYELTECAFREVDKPRVPLQIVSTEWLDANVREWRDSFGAPAYCVQDDKAVRLVPAPNVAGVLLLEGFRLPVAPLALTGADPEIGESHQRHLVEWVLHRVYSWPDTERFDPVRSQTAERAFTRYFGERPDSDMRRITRHDVQHHVEAFWP